MNRIKLDSRLSAVASLVRDNVTVADIGTDHAYLLAYLLQQGKILNGIAADLRKGPLENAKKTLIECEQLEKVRLILSDGLDELKKGDCDDIVIAGMGGILIKEILERTSWVFDGKIHIIAQPMTHAEVLREFFIEKGFNIEKEVAATDGKHNYCVILAVYDGNKRKAEKWYTYIGELYKNSDDNSIGYINKVITTLERKCEALKKAGVNDGDDIEFTLKEIRRIIKEV